MSINVTKKAKKVDLSVKGELEDFVVESMKAVAIDFLNRVTLASPVDKGTFRANWVVSAGSDSNDFNLRYTSPTSQINRNKKAIKSFNINEKSSIFISNNLPYAARLNNGYSKQAPKHFVEIAARNAGINVKDGDFGEDVK